MWSLHPSPFSTILIYQCFPSVPCFQFLFLLDSSKHTNNPVSPILRVPFPPLCWLKLPFSFLPLQPPVLSLDTFSFLLSWLTFIPVTGPATQTVHTYSYKLTISILILPDLSIPADPANNCFHSQVLLSFEHPGPPSFMVSLLCHFQPMLFFPCTSSASPTRLPPFLLYVDAALLTPYAWSALPWGSPHHPD